MTDTRQEGTLASTHEGKPGLPLRELMTARIVSATRALAAEATGDEVLRVAFRAYLAFLADESAFARVFGREALTTRDSGASACGRRRPGG